MLRNECIPWKEQMNKKEMGKASAGLIQWSSQTPKLSGKEENSVLNLESQDLTKSQEMNQF